MYVCLNAVELGRFDGLVSRASDVNGRLPQPTNNLNQLNSLFAANGLTQTDMIALSGNPRATVYKWVPLVFVHAIRLVRVVDI